jgi:hypothetical protein
MDLFPSFNTYPIYVDIVKVEIQKNKIKSQPFFIPFIFDNSIVKRLQIILVFCVSTNAMVNTPCQTHL